MNLFFGVVSAYQNFIWKICFYVFFLFLTLLGTLCTETNELPNKVASGEITENSAVIWGKASVNGEIVFEVSASSSFDSVIFTRTFNVTDTKIPVKSYVPGLSPATRYYYRGTDNQDKSSTGHFRTLPAAGSIVGLTFGVSGDSKGDLIPFYGLSNAADADLDFFVNMGDTIYADFASPKVGWWQVYHIDDFRLKYDEVFSEYEGINYYSDLRASTPVFATIDDHEVINNFAGGDKPSNDGRFDQTGSYINETGLYQNGIRSFMEFHPILNEFYSTPDSPRTDGKVKLYRTRRFGATAEIFILDGRSFRDPPLEFYGNPNDSADIEDFMNKSLTRDRTILGAAQLADLKADLLSSQTDGILWKFVFISVPIQHLGVFFADDRYEGYAKERNDLLAYIHTNNIKNVVFVTADMHGMVANNLTYTSGGSQVFTDSFEVLTGPIGFDTPMGYWTVFLGDLYGETASIDTDGYGSMTKAEKDRVVQKIINNQLARYDYSPIGLDDSSLSATLLSGQWLATFVFGWTKFEIDQATQDLTVKTYGLGSHSYFDLLFNRHGISQRTPSVYSKFIVSPM
jgi:3-phytase/alkaline phosphatase D